VRLVGHLLVLYKYVRTAKHGKYADEVKANVSQPQKDLPQVKPRMLKPFHWRITKWLSINSSS